LQTCKHANHIDAKIRTTLKSARLDTIFSQ